MRISLVPLLTLAALAVSLADPASAQEEPEIYEIVEQQPELIGGLEDLQRRVEYPEMARRAGIEGKVFIQFVVDERGEVSQAVCARSPNQILCDAAIKAVRESRFRPGMQRGRPVKVRFTLPIDFKLRDAAPASPMEYFFPLLGERWNPTLAQRELGLPRSGSVKDGNGTISYTGMSPGVDRVIVTVSGGVIQQLRGTFPGEEGRRILQEGYQSYVEHHGEPADNGAFSPGQLGLPIRVEFQPEMGLIVAEYRGYDQIDQDIIEEIELDFDLPPPPPPPPADPLEPEIFEVVEQQPELIGGLAGLQERLRQLPDAPRVDAFVYVQFVVTPEGRVTEPVCVRAADRKLCDAAITVVEASSFRPGRQRGRAVPVRYTLPVRFSE